MCGGGGGGGSRRRPLGKPPGPPKAPILPRAPFNNSAPFGVAGLGGPTTATHSPWTHTTHHPPPLKRLGQIFFRAFGRSKVFSGAFGADDLAQKFSSAPQSPQHHWGGGGGGLDAPPLHGSPAGALYNIFSAILAPSLRLVSLCHLPSTHLTGTPAVGLGMGGSGRGKLGNAPRLRSLSCPRSREGVWLGYGRTSR